MRILKLAKMIVGDMITYYILSAALTLVMIALKRPGHEKGVNNV